MHGEAVAAIDCGTNSTRLLVATAGGATVERLMTITRLGAGVDRTGMLAADAIGRTTDALRRYRAVMDRHGVGPVRMTATSAARDAANRDEFFAAAEAAVGVAPELLGGDEEGRLSFAGATADLDPSTGPWLVADIGGGSTELAAGPPDGATDRLVPTAVCSLDVGCVRITERFLHHDPPTPGELAEARTFVAGQLEGAAAAHPAFGGATRLVGLAGTVAAAAALDLARPRYDRDLVHHHRLPAGRVRRLLVDLSSEDGTARRRRPGMEEARADVIVGGLLVLDALLGCFGLDECLTSEADILDGLIMTLVAT